MMSPVKAQHDFVLEIAQEIKNNRLKEWSEERKRAYWEETARTCEEIGIEQDFIKLISSGYFKETVGNSHHFTNALDIPFYEVDKHYGTMRAGAAMIIRKRNPSVFQDLRAKAEAR